MSQVSTTHRKRFEPEEDDVIKHLVDDLKITSWDEIANHLPGRTARQCRDRYNNYLYKKIVQKPWTQEEDELILLYYKQIGPRWMQISEHLFERSGNNVKNRWYKFISKRRDIIYRNICKREKQRDDAIVYLQGQIELQRKAHFEKRIEPNTMMSINFMLNSV